MTFPIYPSTNQPIDPSGAVSAAQLTQYMVDAINSTMATFDQWNWIMVNKVSPSFNSLPAPELIGGGPPSGRITATAAEYLKALSGYYAGAVSTPLGGPSSSVLPVANGSGTAPKQNPAPVVTSKTGTYIVWSIVAAIGILIIRKVRG